MSTTASFYPSILAYIDSLSASFAHISADRKERLAEIAAFIQKKRAAGEPIEFIFICTHNSRRSHFAQIWGHVLAVYHGINDVSSFSGGTESTAFHPHAIEAFRAIGFKITSRGRENNPRYKVRFSDEIEPIKAWSKMYTDLENPRKRFCAVMVCDHADKNCPLIFGAKQRFSLPYKDPKASDGSPEQAAVYAARCHQIAVEMNYMYSLIS
jgi:protein-tyrosine-phosphatase